MKLYTIKYDYFIEYSVIDYTAVYADNVAHAYQQFKKIVCTSHDPKFRNWSGLCEIKEAK